MQADDRCRKLLQDLDERLGAKVTKVKNEQLEALMLGALIYQVKPGGTLSREQIMKKLNGK